MTDLSPIWISLKTATTATIITFFLGIMAARWMLGYQGKFKEVIESLLTAPLVLPPTVVGFLLLLFLGKNGFLGQILAYFGIKIVFSWYATVIASTVVAFPLMYKTALGAFKQIDTNLFACARTLGATESRIFWEIMLPLAKPGLLAGTLLAFARALGEFGATLMLAGSIPGKTETIPIAIFFAAESGQMDQALLLVIIMLAISLGVITAVNYGTDNNNPYKITFIPEGWERGRGQQWIINAVSLIRSLLPRKLLIKHKQSLDYSLPQQQIKLIVDIQKQLPGFVLDVSFETDQTPLGLLGASGAGKSLILRCIAGLETPDQGRIVLNGQVLFDSEKGINLPTRDRHCGFLFQNYALFPHLTIAENIAFGMSSGKSEREIKQEVEKHLISVDLAGIGDYPKSYGLAPQTGTRSEWLCLYAKWLALEWGYPLGRQLSLRLLRKRKRQPEGHRYPAELSGGQQQRVALARAKASKPGILLLDEPFSALDTYLRDKQAKILRNNLIHYQGVTLFITHNLEEAYRVCPNLVIIDNGKAIAHGTKQDIFERPGNYRTAQVTGCKNFSRAVIINKNQVQAIDWNCTLETIVPANFTDTSSSSELYVGIRAHQLIFPNTDNKVNTFPCWLATISETQHRMTLYLKLNQPANHPEDYHLQAEVFKDQWLELKDHSFPWTIQLRPVKIMLLNKR